MPPNHRERDGESRRMSQAFDWMKRIPGQTYTPKGGLPLTFFQDIAPALDCNDFVEGVFTNGSFNVVYGDRASFKTFFVLDLALHVAAHREWNGREVDGGVVLYLALEGGNGIKNRIEAARKRLELPDNIPFALVNCPIDLRSAEADTAKVIETVKHLAGLYQQPVRMVGVDTLSRAMAGGEENGSADMGALVRNADHIRHETSSSVFFIHHCGKDAARGMRGHSLLAAATDTEIELSRSDSAASARIARQRDLDSEGTVFAFRLDKVEVGTNTRGKPVSSCIVQPIEAPKASEATRKKPLHEEAISLKRHIDDVIARDGETGKPDPDMPPVRMVSRKVLHAELVERGWLLTRGADCPGGKSRQFGEETKIEPFAKVAKRVASEDESAEQVPHREWDRLYKRLNVLQISGLIAFNRHHVWLPSPVNEAEAA